MRNYGISFCASYTLVSVVLSVLNNTGDQIMGNIWIVNIQLALVCLAIAVLMFVSDTLMNHGEENVPLSPLGIAMDLLDVAVPVPGLGGFVFHWFNVFSYQILYPVVIMIAAYFVVLLLFIINNKHTEKQLNQKIQERKEMMQHDK